MATRRRYSLDVHLQDHFHHQISGVEYKGENWRGYPPSYPLFWSSWRLCWHLPKGQKACNDTSENHAQYGRKDQFSLLELGVCGAFGPWTPSARWARIKSGAFGQNTRRGFWPEYTLRIRTLRAQIWGLQKILYPHTYPQTQRFQAALWMFDWTIKDKDRIKITGKDLPECSGKPRPADWSQIAGPKLKQITVGPKVSRLHTPDNLL